MLLLAPSRIWPEIVTGSPVAVDSESEQDTAKNNPSAAKSKILSNFIVPIFVPKEYDNFLSTAKPAQNLSHLRSGLTFRQGLFFVSELSFGVKGLVVLQNLWDLY